MSRTGVQNVGIFIACAIVALLGAMAFVRLAPVDAARWHVAQEARDLPPGTVTPEVGGAWLRLPSDAPADLLARLDAIAMATPRTARLAGSVAEGRITWETRSALWGFPDYTTAELTPEGVVIHARLRFGREDMGVNAARLAAWQAQL